MVPATMQLLNPQPNLRQPRLQQTQWVSGGRAARRNVGQRQDRSNPSAITQVLASAPINLLTSTPLVLRFVGGQLSCARFLMAGFDQNSGSDALLLFLSRRKTVVRRPDALRPFSFLKSAIRRSDTIHKSPRGDAPGQPKSLRNRRFCRVSFTRTLFWL